jgi:hypothetical protein
MLHRLGSVFRIEITVPGAEDASPLCRIISDADGKYWSGSFWQSDTVSLSMEAGGDGVYFYDINFTSAGDYTVHCDDNARNFHESFGVTVYDAAERTIFAAAGRPYTAKFLAKDDNGSRDDNATLRLVIRDDETGEYLTSEGRFEEYVDSEMYLFGEGVYIYTFIPDKAGSYTMMCFNETNGSSDAYALEVVDLSVMAGEGPLVSANSSNIPSTDGTNSVIKDADGNPISGATISAYDNDNNLVSRCVSIYDGTWQLYLLPGQYRFEFMKDGYLPVSFGRTVE